MAPNASRKKSAPVCTCVTYCSTHARSAKRTASSPRRIHRNAGERRMKSASPSRVSFELRARGIEKTSAPSSNAMSAHVKGTRVCGARNMKSPVLMPSGGASSERAVTGALVSR